MKKAKKSKKLSISKLQKLLWEECKRVVRKLYSTGDGRWICYTCGKLIVSNYDAHTAHFIPNSVSGAYIRYDLRNLRVCCMACNVYLGGNGAAYYRNMIVREGQAYVDQLFQDKQKVVKAYDHYLEQYEEYKKM